MSMTSAVNVCTIMRWRRTGSADRAPGVVASAMTFVRADDRPLAEGARAMYRDRLCLMPPGNSPLATYL